MTTLYAGPGDLIFQNTSFQAEGENGPIRATITEATADVASAMHGHITQQLVDSTAEIVTRPFDDWNLISLLFPGYIGVLASGSPAALLIGTRPHNPIVAGSQLNDQHAQIWTPDGRLYDFVRAAIIGHPSLHLGVGRALYGDVRLACIGTSPTPQGTGATIGQPGYLMTNNVITESGAAPPPGPGANTFGTSTFVRESWVGSWGTVPGFSAIQAQEEWTIDANVKYSPLKVQNRTVAYKLDSSSFMARVRPYGPTHSQTMTAIGAHFQGQRLGSADLVLTSNLSNTTITLKNAEIHGAGFEFGGTQIGSGEIGFVNTMRFSAGTPLSLLEFSALVSSGS